MVEHALRADAEDRVWAAHIARLSQAEEQDFQSFIDNMDQLTHDILEEEIVRPSQLKKILEH